jgi:hypothetical protein
LRFRRARPWRRATAEVRHQFIASATSCRFKGPVIAVDMWAVVTPLVLVGILALLHPTWRAAEQQDPELMRAGAHYGWGYGGSIYAAWPVGAPTLRRLAYWIRHLPTLVIHTTVVHWSSPAALLVVCLACSMVAAALLRLRRPGMTAAAAISYSIGMALYPTAYALCQGMPAVEGSPPWTAFTRATVWQCPSCASAQRAVQVG